MNKKITAVFLLIIGIIFILVFVDQRQKASSSSAANALAMGIIGDSVVDEYRADDNRAGGTSYAATTLNWVELGVKYNRLNVGSWSSSSRGDPRRAGYEYNWAKSGAKVHDIISQGQVSGVVNQIKQGKFNNVFIQVGSNDFLPANSLTSQDSYSSIYNGTLTGTALNSKLDAIVLDFTSSVNSLLEAGVTHIYITNIGDPGISPNTQKVYTDATKRARVTNAISSVNARLSMLSSQKVHVIDMGEFANSLLSSLNNGALNVSGVNITFTNGWAPTNLILGDGVHTGTVGSGLLLNFFLSKISLFSGNYLSSISDSEILSAAGILTQTLSPTVNPTQKPTVTPATQTPVSTKTIKIVARPSGNTQKYFMFDGIVENKQLQTEVSSNRFTYTGSWSLYSSRGVSDSPFKYTTSVSSVSFSTNAQSVDIQTATYPQGGSFEIYVNNILKKTISAYSQTLKYTTVSVPL